VASADLKNQIKTNFPNFVKAYFSDVIENSKTGNACIEDLKNKANKANFLFWKNTMFAITKWQNRFFTVLAVLLSVFFIIKRNKIEKGYLFVSFFILYIIILSGISCGQGDRFHLVTFPFVILLLAKFISGKSKIREIA